MNELDLTPHCYDKNTWFNVRLPFKDKVGSFDEIKVMFLNDSAWAGRNLKVRMTQKTLPTANGYWCLDGREFTFTYKNVPIAKVRTEDCGLGGLKARLFAEYMEFKIA
jgi:hypothetical protein